MEKILSRETRLIRLQPKAPQVRPPANHFLTRYLIHNFADPCLSYYVVQLADFAEPLNELRTCLLNGSNAIGTMLSLLPPKGNNTASVLGGAPASPTAAHVGVSPTQQVWGKLIALKPKQLTGVSMSGSSFSIGGNNRCDLTLMDPSIGSTTICKIHHAVRTQILYLLIYLFVCLFV